MKIGLFTQFLIFQHFDKVMLMAYWLFAKYFDRFSILLISFWQTGISVPIYVCICTWRGESLIIKKIKNLQAVRLLSFIHSINPWRQLRFLSFLHNSWMSLIEKYLCKILEDLLFCDEYELYCNMNFVYTVDFKNNDVPVRFHPICVPNGFSMVDPQ